MKLIANKCFRDFIEDADEISYSKIGEIPKKVTNCASIWTMLSLTKKCDGFKVGLKQKTFTFCCKDGDYIFIIKNNSIPVSKSNDKLPVRLM